PRCPYTTHILAIPCRARPPLFPYTTLFRSKTSTLYTLLAHLATSERKLITVEDPIEYELPGVVQTQVNERAGYTFHRAMRAMLRSEEHTSELQSRENLVCRLLLEKKNAVYIFKMNQAQHYPSYPKSYCNNQHLNIRTSQSQLRLSSYRTHLIY